MESGVAGEPQVIKPSRGAWKTGPVLLAGLFLVGAFTTYRRNEDIVVALGVLVTGAVVVAAVAFTVLRSQIEIRDGEVIRRGALRSTRVTAASLDRVVWIPALLASQGNRYRARVVAVSRSGAAELRLSEGMIWSRDAVVRVAQALAGGARVVTVDQQVTAGMLKRVDPAAASWGERNPWLVALLSLLGTFGVLALLFGIFVLTT